MTGRDREASSRTYSNGQGRTLFSRHRPSRPDAEAAARERTGPLRREPAWPGPGIPMARVTASEWLVHPSSRCRWPVRQLLECEIAAAPTAA